ncbi:MAG: tetratricopeptide repeat protein [Candidatus Adiutrix sp.]|jgi:Flp pilus assembly protein TadD|nr:tetratricopeptide repeat protein [Candidatus Adiutrix sp.]
MTFARKTALIAALSLAVIGATLGLGRYLLQARAAERERAEVALLAADLASALRAEEPAAAARSRVAARLAGLEARSPAGSALLLGALAFFNGDPGEAARLFGQAAAARPDDPNLPSFQAAANLRLGNHALALDLYRRALDLKAGAGGLARANDEMGAALALFLLGRAGEAQPLVEKAWRARLAALGPQDPDTLAAANRLATAYVHLGRLDEAEVRLRETYQSALIRGEPAAEALNESRLLLTVLYNRSGRLAELEDFFDRELAAATAVKVPPSRPPLPSAAIAETETAPAAGAADLAAWERIARALAGRDNALAADLWEKIAAAESPEAGGFGAARGLDLARAVVRAGRFERAEQVLTLLHPRNPAEETEWAILAAETWAGRGRLKEAEATLARAAEAFDAQLDAARKAGRKPDPGLVELDLSLHLKLAENFLAQGRVPQEAEIELRSALGRLDRRAAALYPAAAEATLRLARLTRALGRPGDSREFYKRAQAGAEAQLKAGDPGARAALAEVARAAAEEAASGRKIKPASARAPGPLALPEPESLRLELAALAALERLEEFPARLRPVLDEVTRRFGPESREGRLYFSLWLKWLEESGRMDDLTRELLAQAAAPPGGGETEKRLNQGGALFYAARANEKAGRRAEAAGLYQRAREAWLVLAADRRVAGRLAEVEAALARLEAAGISTEQKK